MPANRSHFHSGCLIGQILRYGVVGILANALVYVIYLVITSRGIAPRHAIMVSYTFGACLGFIANRQWTFAARAELLVTLIKYAAAHGMGYALNFCLIWFFHERFGFPHQWVQCGAIVLVAVFLFLVFRFFVFTPSAVPRRKGGH